MTIITAVVSAEPFVGRRQELERLREAFDGARDGRGSLVMITGEPGIGKTRLARELEGYASEHGARVLWGRAHEAGGAPAYWPWVQALRQLVEATDGEELRGWLGSGAGEVARVVPELRAHLPDLPEPEPITDPESAQFRLFDALATCLRNVASATPLVLVLDDLHWADRSTLEALQVIAPPDRQIAIVQEALEAIGEDEPYLEAMLSAVVIGTIGRPAIDAETVADLEQRTRALVDRHHFEDVAALLLLADGVRLAYDGRLDEAAAACGQAHERLAALGLVSDAATAAYELVALRCVIGDLDAAERAGKEALAYASGVHLRLTEANLRVYLASVALSRCDFDRFDALAAELSGEDTTGFAQLLTTRAEMAGDGEGALASMPVPQMAGGIPAWLAWLHGCRARVFFNAGEERAAREEFGRSIEMSEAATGGDGRQPWPDSAAELDECLLALGDDALAGRVYWYLVGLMSEAKLGRLGRGLDHIRGALALRLDLVEEAEQHYRTGLEWAEREGVPIELGRCHQGLAEVAVRRGEIAEALEHLDTAAELFERHGAKLYLDQVRARQEELRPPARGRRASYPAGLTEREVEVLRLVAAGKANRAIAEALVISVSTVTHHITNIFNKLGVKNRAQATRRAVEHDLTQ